MRLETERLILRPWEDRDRPLYAEIIGDPEVRRYFPAVGTRRDADEAINRAIQRLAENGYGFLAVERKSDGAMLGMLGIAPFLQQLLDVVPNCPPAEVGWQLGRPYWNQGYATEGASACLRFGFEIIGLPEIGAITYEGNIPSRRVMEKLGMVHDRAAKFWHPQVPRGHRLRPHVLYRLSSPDEPTRSAPR